MLWSPCNLGYVVPKKTRGPGLPVGDPRFNSFDALPASDRQTDGHVAYAYVTPPAQLSATKISY